MLVCPNCEAKYEEGKKFCKACGTALISKVEEQEPEKSPVLEESVEKESERELSPITEEDYPEKTFCPSCGIPYQEGQKFCKGCGAALVVSHKVSSITHKGLDKGYIKSLIKNKNELLKKKQNLEKLLHNLEAQRGVVSEETFATTKKLYLSQNEEINSALLKTQEDIDGLRSKLLEKVRQLEKEIAPFQEDLNDIQSLFKSGGMAKEDFRKGKSRLDSQINPRKKELENKKKLLNILLDESSAEQITERRIPTFTKVLVGLLILLLVGGGLYIASTYFEWGTDFVSSLEERISSPTDSEVAFDVRVELGKHDYRDIGVKFIEGKVILSGKVSTEEEKEVIQNLATAVKGVKEVENNIVIEEIISDEIILSEIQREFQNEGYENIKVEVNNGIITLSGSVTSPEDQNTILSTAMNINGVKQVENNVDIVEIRSDPDITSDIRRELRNKGYEKIEVEVNNRKAILSGIVSSSKEQKLIQDITAKVEGVESVENNINVKPKAPSDSDIAAAVKKRLRDNGFGKIGVYVINRKAILTGSVNGLNNRKTIGSIAMGVKGVKSVENNVRVVEVISDKDVFITSEVKRAIARSGYSGISVSVTKGEVLLSGTVRTHNDHLAIHDIALKVNGVKRVKSDLSVLEYSR